MPDPLAPYRTWQRQLDEAGEDPEGGLHHSAVSGSEGGDQQGQEGVQHRLLHPPLDQCQSKFQEQVLVSTGRRLADAAALLDCRIHVTIRLHFMAGL